MKSALLAAAFALLPTTTLAQSLPTFSSERLTADIRTLSSDAFEGRAPATPGETKTVDHLVAQLKAAGLEPGNKGSWTQDVPLLMSDIVGKPSLALTYGGRTRALTQGEEIAARAALNGSRAVSIAGAPLVFLGYGVAAPERQWDDFKGVDTRGKIGVVLINDPDFETGQGDFGGKAMTYYGRWTYKYEEAARRGMAGLLIVHETAPASYGWPTVKNSNTNTTFDIVRADPAAAHVPLEGWIQRDLAVDLFKAAGLDFEAEKRRAQTRDFRPVELKATLAADYQVNARVIASKNVVAKVTGSERPDETVIYTAHWDHLGIGLPDARGDRIYNGAVDNATGTAALLELARAYAKAPKPQRTVLFLAVTAEERGLLGSEYYVANPIFPLAKTAGVLNMDALGVAGPARDFTSSGNARQDLLDRLIAVGAKAGRTYSPDPLPEAGHFFRSDHFPFAKRGVPAVSFGSGEDLLQGGTARGKAVEAAYVRDQYHQPADEWSPSWDVTGITADLGLLYETGRQLANSRDWPNWSADSEFRALRDASAAERR